MRNIRLDICYDGTRYRGWQRLPGKDDTIQGKLETCLSKILGEEIEISFVKTEDKDLLPLPRADLLPIFVLRMCVHE